MLKKTKYFLAATALLGLALSGCSKTDGSATVSNLNPNSFQPKGTVAGVLLDAVTNDPIANATIYIMDKSAITNAGGSFTIANVSANLATGNEPGNPIATDPYQVVIDMKAVNDAVTAYNAVAANTTKKAYYPSFAYTTATVKYDSLGDAALIDAAGNTSAGTSATNHDTPVDGFVASIAPKVGKLDANVKIQVVNSSTFANISGATVELISRGSGSLANTPTGNAIVVGTTGHIVATGTTDANGLVTFSGVEAKSIFAARATSSDGMLSGTTNDPGLNDGNANKGPVSISTEADNVTVSYLLNQNPKNALMISPVDDQVPVILSSTPELNSDLTVPTTGGQDVVFTFSKAIQADAYALATTASSVNAAAPIGTGTLYKDISVTFDGSKAGNIAYTLTWSTDMKTLTVNLPSLSPSSKYTVDLTLTNLVDSLNQPVANILTAGKVMFTTNGGATAAAPTVVVVNSATIDSTSNVNLDWNPASGAKKYNVYRSLIENWGTTTTASPYRLIGTDINTSDYSDTFADVLGIGGACAGGTPTGGALCGAISYDTTNGALANFVESGHVKLTYSYVVKSVNSDLTEGAASTAVPAADVISEVITTSTAVTAITTNLNTITLTFNEPLDEASAETVANYALGSISGTPPTVTSAVYNGYVGVISTVTLTLSGNLDVTTIIKSKITTGPNGLLQTPKNALDSYINTASQTAILAGADTITQSVPCDTDGDGTANGTCDDALFVGGIDSGLNGVVETVKRTGSDDVTVLVFAVNKDAIDAGANYLLESVPTVGDDVAIRAPFITVSGVKDVAGNLILTTGATKMNVVNTDGTIN